MAEVGAAFGADDLGAGHAQGVVGFFDDAGFANGLEVARPAASGIKLGVGEE